MRRLRRAACALSLGALVPTTAHAQRRAAGGPCVLPTVYFSHERASVDDASREWTPARRTAAFEKLDRVHEIVRASPRLAPLPSYRLVEAFHAGLPNGYPYPAAEGAGAPLPGYYALRLFEPDTWEGACGLRKGVDAAATVAVVANVLGMILEDQSTSLLGSTDAPDMFYMEPKVVRRVGGYPQYENGTILITRAGRSPFIRVSQERWLRAVIAMFQGMVESGERGIAEQRNTRIDAGALGDSAVMITDSVIAGMEQLYEMMKATDPKGAARLKENIDRLRAERPQAQANARKMHALQPTIEAQRELLIDTANVQADSIKHVIRTIEAYLASLTPAQRRADAYFGPKIEYGYTVPSPGPEDRRVVMLDPNYFDRGLPRTAIQVLGIITSFAGGSNVYHQTSADQFAERVARSLDYARLSALLAR